MGFTAPVLTLSPPPSHPEPTAPRFPLLLTVIPLVAAAVLSLWLAHPLALAMGVLGPVIAGAHFFEARRAHRQALEDHRTRNSEAWRDYDQRRDHLGRQWLHTAHHANPPVTEWLLLPVWQPPRWEMPLTLRLGRGSARVPGVSEDDPLVVEGAPALSVIRSGCAVVGDSPAARALYRSLAVQVLAARSTLDGPFSLSSIWPVDGDIPPKLSVCSDQSPLSINQPVGLSLCPRPGDVPPEADIVVVVRDASNAELLRPGHSPLAIVPEGITEAQAMWCRERISPGEPERSDSVSVDTSNRGALWCRWSQIDPPWDLVAEGPHLLIWGQTGSGKSVALQRLITSVASVYSPEEVTVVLCDFKGGASLVPLHGLPHIVGVATDLTEETARRAAISIRAEMRRREHLLATHRVADLGELPRHIVCPRTLLVVDEVHALLHALPEMSDILSDVASRGRSLGIHLVVSGQRIGGVVPRPVLANAPARLALRVTDQSDWLDGLPGVPLTLFHTLDSAPHGSGVFRGLRTVATRVTPEPSGSEESWRIASRWTGRSGEPWWAPPLPRRITFTEESARLFSLGQDTVAVLDDPAHQAHIPWSYDLRRDGPLWVVGDDYSGHSTLMIRLDEVASRQGIEVLHLAGTPEALWWQLSRPAAQPNGLTRRRWILADRIDRALVALTDEQIHHVIEALLDCARADQDTGVIVTSGPSGPVARALRRQISHRVLLQHRTVEDWVSNGGDAALWSTSNGSGRGVWPGGAGQIVLPEGRKTRCEPLPVGIPLVDLVARTPSPHLLIARERPVWWTGEDESFLAPHEAAESWHRVQDALSRGLVVGALNDVTALRHLVGSRADAPIVPARAPFVWAWDQGRLQLAVI